MRLSAAIAIGASVAVLAAGQDQQQTPPPQPPPPVPTFRAEANYVRVDVYPTVDGAPVTDLRLEDFEVSEDRVLQKVEQFERVVIAGGAGQPGRPEPNTVEESRRAVQDPRARVFVLFLDLKHVEGDASRTIARPLVKALNSLIGPDDYVAAMTPGMSARDITFARRRTSIEGLLSREWWGERDRVNFSDPVENQYALCYPGIPKSDQFEAPDKGIAQEMILRRREKQTLDALEDLSRFLRDVREERKAVITITDGWLLYGPNRNLARPLENIGAPPVPGINIDPRNGKLTNKDTVNKTDNTLASCESDRYVLSELNNDQRMRTIFDEANRANVSFYPDRPARPRRLRRTDCSDGRGGLRSIREPDVIAGSRSRPPRRAQQLPAEPRRGDRRSGHCRHEQHREGLQANHRRHERVLPARVLLDREARRPVPFDSSSRQTSGRGSARAPRLPGAERRRCRPRSAEGPDAGRARRRERHRHRSRSRGGDAARRCPRPAAARARNGRLAARQARARAGSRRPASGRSPRWPIAFLEARSRRC